MIVSDTKSFIFIHIPKTAGTSLRTRLRPFDTRGHFYWDPGHHHEFDRKVDFAHLTLADLRSYSDYQLLDRYFTFAFVRSPYHRLVSAFSTFSERHNTKGLNCSDFFVSEVNHEKVRRNWRFIHFCPQNAFTHNGNKSVIDWIGRFENLEKDTKRLSKLLDIPEAAIQQRATDFKDPREILSEEAIEKVNRFYERDFQLFGYDMV